MAGYLKAFHSFWSAPNRIKNGGKITFPDYEQVTAILSALLWKKHNGPVCMITDSPGAELLEILGLLPFWDETVVALDGLENRLNPVWSWAAGKLAALKTMPIPCVMLDTDLIVWKNLSSCLNADVIAAHAEPLNPRTYPDPASFRMKAGFYFPRHWDFTESAANTAFLYLKNAGFRDLYTDAALDFLRNVEVDHVDPVQTMCFAEQRLLPVCAKANGQKLGFLIELRTAQRQDLLTHNWGFKQILSRNRAAREEFCLRCVRRILIEAPETVTLLDACRDLSGYLKEVQTAI